MEFKPQNIVRGLFQTMSVLVFAIILGVVAAGAAFVYNITRGLPDVKSLKEYHHSHATEVYSDEGRKIGEFTTERRYPVKFDQIPKHVIQAFLAAEDSHFYQHGGIQFTGILRAVLTNVLRGRAAQGASTITQQVARGILLSSRKKEITRKIREMVLARRMEQELTKNEILALYLSDIYLGHGAYGIGAAAQNYFRKKVEDLTIAEASMLAGLPQRPNEWDPFRNPALAKKRQQYVLKRMVDENFITEPTARTAFAETLKLYAVEDLNNTAAPYFTEYVRQYLMNRYGSENILSQGFKIYTTVRYDYQKHAEKVLGEGLRQVDKRLGWRGVPMHLDSTPKVEQFLAQVHEDVLSALTPARVLRADIDAKSKKLDFDLTAFSELTSAYYGETPISEGKYYRAVIIQVNDAQKHAQARIGKTAITMPLAGIEWVRSKLPTFKNISQVLKPGDVVDVKISKIDKRAFQAEALLEQEPEVQGAILSYDVHTGFVKAMVGGTDFNKSKFNIALQAKRQVGSTFKPVMYAAAMDRGFSPSSIVTDSPIVFKFEGQLDADNTGEAWRPHNYNGKFVGDIPLRLALIRSMNIPTVKLLNELSIDYVIQYARTLGITSVMQRDLSIALGSWSSSLEELSRAYAVFPRLGKPIGLNYIKKVVDINGKIVEEHTSGEVAVVPRNAVTPDDATKGVSATAANVPPVPELPAGCVISPQTAYVMTDMLKGVVREGTGTAAATIAGAAGKTGTSNDHRDAWFIGYTPQMMTGVWLGYEKDKPLDAGETGGRAATPIWTDYMTKVVQDYPKAEYSIPDNIAFAYIDRETGKLASTSSKGKRVRVAFKVGGVPNATGENLPRIGEPGMRSMTQSEVSTTAGSPSEGASPAKGEETSDFLRQGYQE